MLLTEELSLLKQASQSVITKSFERPNPKDVVDTLLNAEKSQRHNQEQFSFEKLIGTWQLGFITGTKKARNRAGIVLGAGRYIPHWLKIHISYSSTAVERGRVTNVVQLGYLQLYLTGPVKFISRKSLLVFDFSQMNIKLFGIPLFQGYIRNGKHIEETFYTESIAKQAFFSYFIVSDELIAARGRGGGLALWGRSPQLTL
jgi:hypothetical protein